MRVSVLNCVASSFTRGPSQPPTSRIPTVYSLARTTISSVNARSVVIQHRVCGSPARRRQHRAPREPDRRRDLLKGTPEREIRERRAATKHRRSRERRAPVQRDSRAERVGG